MREILVRYISFPDIEDGVSSFYEYFGDGRCTEPSQPYVSGRCHTKEQGLDELALKVGFMTRKEFSEERRKKNFNSWKNAYGEELSLFVGKLLETEGIVWNVSGVNVLFKCPKGEFVPWPGKRHKNNTKAIQQ